MQPINIKFLAKYIITYDIECKTGLHIGGGDTSGRIGELDNPVIKDTMHGYPIIAGSSLKGRIRERLEWTHIDPFKKNSAIERQLEYDDKGKLKLNKVGPCNCGDCDICHYFGHSNHEKNEGFFGPTRIIFRDAFPKQDDEHDQIEVWENKLGKENYTEIKFENTISRLTAVANPRQMERVPAGSIFSGEIVIDIYDIPGRESDNINTALTLIFKGMALIENSFLGGGGSRGSGVVQFKSFKVTKYATSYFTNPDEKGTNFGLVSASANELLKSKEFDKIA